MYILEEHNLGFIAHPKTASTATQMVLQDLGAKLYGNHHEVKEDHCRRILDSGGLIISTIRNPFDLFVSWYFHYAKRRGTRKMESFKEWLPYILKHPNAYMKRGLFYGLKWTNRILRFESLQSDFDRVLTECTVTKVIIQPYNVSHNRKEKPYQWMYNAELISLVLEYCGDQMLDYQFEEIPDEDST